MRVIIPPRPCSGSNTFIREFSPKSQKVEQGEMPWPPAHICNPPPTPPPLRVPGSRARPKSIVTLLKKGNSLRRFLVMPGNYQNHTPSATLNPQTLHVTSTGDMRIKSNWILCFPLGVVTLTIQFKKCVERARSSVRAFFLFPWVWLVSAPRPVNFPMIGVSENSFGALPNWTPKRTPNELKKIYLNRDGFA